MQHKHVFEMQPPACLTQVQVFEAVYDSYRQGIVMTLALQLLLLLSDLCVKCLHTALQAHYASQPFITL